MISNLIFVLSFFVVNKIDTKIIFQNKLKIPKIEGRGSTHNLFLKTLKSS